MVPFSSGVIKLNNSKMGRATEMVHGRKLVHRYLTDATAALEIHIISSSFLPHEANEETEPKRKIITQNDQTRRTGKGTFPPVERVPVYHHHHHHRSQALLGWMHFRVLSFEVCFSAPHTAMSAAAGWSWNMNVFGIRGQQPEQYLLAAIGSGAGNVLATLPARAE